MKAAMRARDSARLSAIRLLLAAIKQREVDERIELGDAEVVAVVEKMIKQRRESIAQFEKAARKDLVDTEKFELEVLSGYLPQQMSEAEIEAAIAAALAESGAVSMKEMGKIMALLRPRLAGRSGKFLGLHQRERRNEVQERQKSGEAQREDTEAEPFQEFLHLAPPEPALPGYAYIGGSWWRINIRNFPPR